MTPSDIDVCQVYDSFTPTVLLTLEGLGFCEKGEGARSLKEEPCASVERSRRTPMAADCHAATGMRGIFLLVEAVRQLRGECGGRQVPGAELACVNGTGGWFSSSGTAILGRG